MDNSKTYSIVVTNVKILDEKWDLNWEQILLK